MPEKDRAKDRQKGSPKPRSARATTEELDVVARQQSSSAAAVQRAGRDPKSLVPHEVLQLQRTIGNRATCRLVAGPATIVSAAPAALVVQRSMQGRALANDPVPTPKNCFMGVLTWLLAEYHGVDDSGDAALRIAADKGKAEGLMLKVRKKGSKLKRPSKTNTDFRVTPDKVVIFASGGTPTHAAVATGAAEITGYNQTKWFGEALTVWSQSDLTGITWASKDTIKNSWGEEENVYQVDGEKAASVFGKVKKT